MERRMFLKLSAAGTALAVAPTIEGCGVSEVEAAINTVLKAAAAVLAVAAPGASWVSELQQAIAALMTAEQGWQNGGPVQYVDDALNTIVAITAVIPLTAVYSPLVDVLVSGIEIVLGLLPASVNVASRLTVDRMAKATGTGNPHIGRYTMKSYWNHPSPEGQFKANWNSVARSSNLGYAILN